MDSFPKSEVLEMSVEKIEKLAEIFIKLAISESTKAKIAPIEKRMMQIAEKASDPASAEAKEFADLKAQYQRIIDEVASHIPVGQDPDTSTFPAAVEWRELKKRLAQLVKASSDVYRRRTDVMRQNRAVVNIIDKAITAAGGDKGVLSQLNNYLRKSEPRSIVINLALAPKKNTAVTVSGGNVKQQQYVASAIAPSARWIDNAMRASKVTPTAPFNYTFAKLPV